MIRRASLSILAMSAVAFLGGLVGSMSARSSQSPPPSTRPAGGRPLGRCLGISTERMAEIDAKDPTFRDDLARLRGELVTRRQALADALESSDSSDEEIRDCVERIIETHNALERRVTEYLLIVRYELSPEQRAKLFRLCAQGVRGGHGRGWGMGRARGQGWGRGTGPARGHGRGGGMGTGRGRGQGPGHGGGWPQADGPAIDDQHPEHAPQ